MELARILFVTHGLAGAVMMGVIWIVQLVHYPAFHYIAESEFKHFEQFHAQGITRFVAPVMLVELIASTWLAGMAPDYWGNWVNAGLVIATWAITFFVSVPLHGALADGKNAAVIDRLIATNWWRTAIWTGKCAFTGILLLAL
ncbi:MAG: hypothetical protein AAGN35_00345 [Bacteroidota bacterium]